MANENTNLVKKWAENMLMDCNTAINALNNTSSRDYIKALQHMSEIKGTCEAIIACMDATDSKDA